MTPQSPTPAQQAGEIQIEISTLLAGMPAARREALLAAAADATHDPHAEHAAAGVAHAADATHEAEHETGYQLPHEIPNIATMLESVTGPWHEVDEHAVHGRPHPTPFFFINPLFSLFYAAVLSWIIIRVMRRASVRRPGRVQSMIELVLGGLRNFFVGIIGRENEFFVPYLMALFLFIWLNNVMVLVPGLKSPDSSFPTTLALAVTTFVVARYHNIRAAGFKGYFYHLLGSPQGPIMWALSPLFLLLELIGEFIKPLSLGLRLFGNILGEDKLLAVFLGLGMMLVAVMFDTPVPPVGIPLHLPFFFLVVLLSTIQAVVFTSLASIYLVLMMPHHDHEHEAHPHEAVNEGEAHGAEPAATF